MMLQPLMNQTKLLLSVSRTQIFSSMAPGGKEKVLKLLSPSPICIVLKATLFPELLHDVVAGLSDQSAVLIAV